MSYFQYYQNNVQAPQNADIIIGTCMSMCPQEEATIRKSEKLVHSLEVIGSTTHMIKCYSRSAADSIMAVPHLLRPYSVLKQTVQYLLFKNTIKRADVPLPVLYDFLNDRLRAVRQDATIQRLPTEQCMKLLEPMIRFHVYFGYKLCEYPLNNFDPVLNRKYLLECIKWFLICCDKSMSDHYNIDALLLGMETLDLNKEQVDLSYNRALVESLYILCNIDDAHPLHRYLNLQKDIKCHPSTRLSYNIALAYMNGNFIKVSRMFEKLCPLTYCAFCINLPLLQRHGLLVMSHAFSSKQLTVPLEVIRRWLLFNSDSEVVEICQHYGVKTENGVVRFNKGDFRKDVVTHAPKKLLLDEKFNLTTDNVFTYSTK